MNHPRRFPVECDACRAGRRPRVEMKRARRTLVLPFVVLALLVTACGNGDTTPTTPTAVSEPTPQPTTGPSTVTVYFSTGDGTDCGQVEPFERAVADDEPGPDVALTELLAGPNEVETTNGASSFFSDATAASLSTVSFVPPDQVVVDFHDLTSLIPNASTSCGSEALLAQLNNTVLQYAERVRYEMQGSCELFANWLQRECMEYTTAGAEPAVLDTDG